nr:methyltransferase domain-containing protein [Anaerolineae bacterium]
MTLSLDDQNYYREIYTRMRPGWIPATACYETLIRSQLAPGMVVLDVGGGRGGVLEQIGDMVSTPLCVDPDFVSLHEHRMPGLPRAASDASRLPFRTGVFDLVLSSWVLEHLDNPAGCFSEAARVLKPGGRFILMTPGAFSPAALLNRLLKPLQRWLVPLLYGRAAEDAFPVAYRANSRRRITRLAAAAGLEVAVFHRIHDPTYFAFTPLFFRINAALVRVLPGMFAEHIVAELHKPAD